MSERLSLLQLLSEIELSPQSCALFVDNFCRSRPAQAETETLLRRSRKPLYPKKTQAFVPESLFNPEFMRSRPLTLPNYLMKMKMKMEIKMKMMMMMMVMMTMVILMILMILMMWLTWRCGWHDDVVDMMMWLPWWWESWPWQSSVTPKFSN